MQAQTLAVNRSRELSKTLPNPLEKWNKDTADKNFMVSWIRVNNLKYEMKHQKNITMQLF